MATKIFNVGALERELALERKISELQKPIINEYFIENRAKLKPTVGQVSQPSQMVYRDPVKVKLESILKPNEAQYVLMSLEKSNELHSFYQFSDPFLKSVRGTNLDASYLLDLWAKFKNNLISTSAIPSISGSSMTAEQYQKSLNDKREKINRINLELENLGSQAQSLKDRAEQKGLAIQINSLKQAYKAYKDYKAAENEKKKQKQFTSTMYPSVQKLTLNPKYRQKELPPEYQKFIKSIESKGYQEYEPMIHPNVKNVMNEILSNVNPEESTFKKMKTVGGVKPPPANLTTENLRELVRAKINAMGDELPIYEKKRIRSELKSASAEYLRNAYAYLAHFKPNKISGSGFSKNFVYPSIARR